MATQQTLLGRSGLGEIRGRRKRYLHGDMTDVMGGEEPEEAQAVIDLIDQIGNRDPGEPGGY